MKLGDEELSPAAVAADIVGATEEGGKM